MKSLIKKVAITIVVFGISCAQLFAQQVKGIVREATGEPVIGAAVMIEGTSIGAITDIDGFFTLNGVSSNATLTVSSIGYVTKSVAVNGQTELDIILDVDSMMLDDVVVVGCK